MSVGEVEKTLDAAIRNLTCINSLYCKSDNYAKRRLIGSIYPEKFPIEDVKVRTAKPSEVFEFIYLINTKLDGNKNGTNDKLYHLSHEVNPLGFESII